MRTSQEHIYRNARLEVEKAFEVFKQARAEFSDAGSLKPPPIAYTQAKERLDAAYEALDRLDFFHAADDLAPLFVPASNTLAA